MDAHAPVDLVVQAHLLVGDEVVAGQLDAVHSEVGAHPSGGIGRLAVDRREGDKRSAIHGPAFESRQIS